jgi:anthranilate phosphoribosyltransferase
VDEYVIVPEDLGLERHALDGLAGGEPEDNARLIRGVLEGRVRGAARAAVVLNAAAAIYVAGRADDLLEAVGLAAETLDSGAALRTLEALVTASRAPDGG